MGRFREWFGRTDVRGCEHDFADWRPVRLRLGGWHMERRCMKCPVHERVPVRMKRSAPA